MYTCMWAPAGARRQCTTMYDLELELTGSCELSDMGLVQEQQSTLDHREISPVPAE